MIDVSKFFDKKYCKYVVLSSEDYGKGYADAMDGNSRGASKYRYRRRYNQGFDEGQRDRNERDGKRVAKSSPVAKIATQVAAEAAVVVT